MMGYSENEFWDMTPRFFAAAVKGWERNNRESWERARMVGYLSIAGYFDPKKATPSVEKVWPLPWDKKAVIIPWTPEEYNELHERRKIKMEARRLHKFDGKVWQQ